MLRWVPEGCNGACSGSASCYPQSLPVSPAGQIKCRFPQRTQGLWPPWGLSFATPGMREEGLGQRSLKVPRNLGFPPAFLQSHKVRPDACFLYLHFALFPPPPLQVSTGGWLFWLIFCLPDRIFQERRSRRI